MKKQLPTLAIALTLSFIAAQANAHGVYFANRLDQKALVLGEGPLDNVYKPEMVKKFIALDNMGRVFPLTPIAANNHISIVPNEKLGISVVDFDYGYFTRDNAGKMHAFKRFEEVADAQKTTHALKFNVHYWNEKAKPQTVEAYIQIVPKVNPLTLHKGDKYEVQVLKEGKPFANAPIIPDVLNDLTTEIKADEQGKAVLTVSAEGTNVVGVEIGEPTSTHTQNKYFSSLSFILYPED
ncbi:DUF4198 domain-containing protein [Avibacterium volantium]|uniref:DUF4198 domain-containing protein n=1 Tax=Avibacterium TaxID=292486 RepID=UPI0039FD2B18